MKDVAPTMKEIDDVLRLFEELSRPWESNFVGGYICWTYKIDITFTISKLYNPIWWGDEYE